MNVKNLMVAVALLALSAAPTTASDGHWKFGLLNKSRLVADGFRTLENGQWSDNWLHAQIDPNETSTMDFMHDDGSCLIRTQITFSDNTFFDYDVDYCKVNNLYIYKNSVKWD